MATATTEPVRLPPGPRIPKLIQGAAVLTARYGAVAALGREYGSTFTLNIPVFGETVVISDPVLVKDLFSTHRDLVGRPQNNLGGDVLGPGSIFNLEGDELQARRKLLLPPFNGKSMRGYESITEEEVIREIRTWPEGVEFETLEPMMRITLNTILRAVFGAEGARARRTARADARRRRVRLQDRADALGRAPRLRAVESRAASSRIPAPDGRAAQLADRRRAQSDPELRRAQRRAVAAAAGPLRQRLDPMPDSYILDELLTMLVAGHETTSTQLAWTVERIRRHPDLLTRLTEEVDAGGNELLLATIAESQRTRPVLTAALRRARTRIQLGGVGDSRR